jgi:hypothetical protein
MSLALSFHSSKEKESKKTLKHVYTLMARTQYLVLIDLKISVVKDFLTQFNTQFFYIIQVKSMVYLRPHELFVVIVAF